MIFAPTDQGPTENDKGRADERAFELDRELDRRTLRELFRNETNARRV